MDTMSQIDQDLWDLAGKYGAGREQVAIRCLYAGYYLWMGPLSFALIPDIVPHRG